jgi:hypothetical protein
MSNKKCGHTVPCGCNDTPYTTPPACGGGIQCDNVDKCPETFCDECTVHCSNTIVESGIQYGERLDVSLQRLTILATNPTCKDLSPVGVKSVSIGTDNAVISWLPVATAVSYTVEYKLTTAPSFTINPVVTPSGNSVEKDTIAGLTSGSDYYVRVIANDGVTTCSSVTILIQTK